MSKLFFLILVVLLVFSCDKTLDRSLTLNYIIINKTNKQFVYFIDSEIGERKINSNGNDSVCISLFKESTVSIPYVGPYYIGSEEILLKKCILYNISDTSLFNFNFGNTIKHHQIL